MTKPKPLLSIQEILYCDPYLRKYPIISSERFQAILRDFVRFQEILRGLLVSRLAGSNFQDNSYAISFLCPLKSSNSCFNVVLMLKRRRPNVMDVVWTSKRRLVQIIFRTFKSTLKKRIFKSRIFKKNEFSREMYCWKFGNIS